MTSLAPFVPRHSGEVKIDDTFLVILKKDASEKAYTKHLKWAQTQMQKDPEYRIVEWWGTNGFYRAHLSQKALLVIRKRNDVEYVCENIADKRFGFPTKVKAEP